MSAGHNLSIVKCDGVCSLILGNSVLWKSLWLKIFLSSNSIYLWNEKALLGEKCYLCIFQIIMSQHWVNVMWIACSRLSHSVPSAFRLVHLSDLPSYFYLLFLPWTPQMPVPSAKVILRPKSGKCLWWRLQAWVSI